MVVPMLRSTLLAGFAFLALSSCAAVPVQKPTAIYQNPVLDADFPDPTVIRARDGFYYAYATQTERDGKMINMQVARSPDLVSWEHLGDALPAKPGWASKTQDFWAPHVAEHGGTYYLYYSAKPDAALMDDKRGLCLAVATAQQPQGPFTDMGRPLKCGETFVNIDPMTFIDPATGKHFYYWGSGFQPIRVQELGVDRASFAPGSRAVDLIGISPSKENVEYQKLVEGAWVHHRDGYYYLFFSGDNCCGPRAHYAVMIARSRSAQGPFELAPNKVLLESSNRWFAPGHNSVITDAAGQDWIVYHAVDVRRPRTKPTDEVNTRRIMLIDRLEWRDGWPQVVRPSSGPRPAPRIAR